MTCQDCVHYEVCKDKWSYELIPIFASLSCRMQKTYMDGMENKCRAFKPKSRFVELPCEVGSKIYMLVTRKTHSFEWNEIGKMYKKQNQHTFIKDTYFTKLNFWKVLEDFGKTVFLSREEAEKALKEREKK